MDNTKPNRGDRSSLGFDERELLETKVIPTAERWLTIPGLARHARQTLGFWGRYDAKRDPEKQAGMQFEDAGR